MKKIYHKRKELSKEILENLYLQQGYSISMIEKELNVSRGNIEYFLRKYNIPKKTQSEIQRSPIIRQKIEETCLKNHGVKAGFADVDKRKQNKKERYGDENYNNPEKNKQTNIKKYGSISYTGTAAYKQSLKDKYEV